MTGVFLAFGGVVVLLFLIGPVYGWVSGWRRRRNQAPRMRHVPLTARLGRVRLERGRKMD